MRRRDGERGGGISHSGQPTEGSRLPWFQSSCGWCCWADWRQAAGCLTAADGATQVSKNTQALSLAYMCHIIPVIIILSTYRTAHTHMCTHTHMHTHMYMHMHTQTTLLGVMMLLAFYVAASSPPPEYTEQSTMTSVVFEYRDVELSHWIYTCARNIVFDPKKPKLNEWPANNTDSYMDRVKRKKLNLI